MEAVTGVGGNVDPSDFDRSYPLPEPAEKGVLFFETSVESPLKYPTSFLPITRELFACSYLIGTLVVCAL